MKMNCGILESCVAIVTKLKSIKGTNKLTFIVMKILLMSLKHLSIPINASLGIFHK